MPQWKKVIMSGSAAELSSLSLDTALPVGSGGTGVATLSSGQVLLGAGTSAITSVARGNIADSGDGKVIVAGGTSAILGTGVTLNIGGNISSGSRLNDISLLTPTDGNIIVGNNTTWVAESGATARTSLGLGTGDSPQFTNLTLTGTIVNSSTVAATRLTGSFTGSFTGDGSGLTGLPTGAITSYTNAANNRLITSVDSTSVNGEANLTFDGSTLSLTGNFTATSHITGSGLNLTAAPALTTDTVAIWSAAGDLGTRTIDSRVWGSSLVDGSGASTRVTFWSDGDTVTSDADFTYNSSTNMLTISGSQFGHDVIIGGNLTVLGTVINQNVTNIAVEDRFILLNSGSASGDGGFVIQTESDFTGVGFGWDDSAERFGLQTITKLSGEATAIAPDAYLAAVVDVDGGQADNAIYQKNGNIRIENGDVYIYA